MVEKIHGTNFGVVVLNNLLRFMVGLAVFTYFTGFVLLTIWDGNFITNFAIYHFKFSQAFSTRAGLGVALSCLMLSLVFFMLMKSSILKLLTIVIFLQGMASLVSFNGELINVPTAGVHLLIASWFFMIARYIGDTDLLKYQVASYIQYSLGLLFIGFSLAGFSARGRDIEIVKGLISMISELFYGQEISIYFLYLLSTFNLLSGVTMLLKAEFRVTSLYGVHCGYPRRIGITRRSFLGFPDSMIRSVFLLMPFVYYLLNSDEHKKNKATIKVA